MKADIYTKEGKKNGEVSLPESVFGLPWNVDLVSQVVRSYELNARQGSAHAKDRSEVRGGGKKPWRQKGTGRARHGSTRSPIWIGGGVTFGPRNDKDYTKKVNRKMKMKALFVALSRKLKDGEVIFVDDLGLSSPKTKEAKGILEAFSSNKDFEGLVDKKKNALLIALPLHNESVLKSFRNMGNVGVKESRNLTVKDVLSKKFLLIVSPEETVKMFESKVGSSKGKDVPGDDTEKKTVKTRTKKTSAAKKPARAKAKTKAKVK